MPHDIFEHPDAPDIEELGEFIVEPLSLDDIQRYLTGDFELVEDNLVEREDLDVRVPLRRDTQGRKEGPTPQQDEDIGTYLYRYTQLLGTPNHPAYFAGEDIRDRTNETFKYVLRVTAPPDDDLPEEWLITVFDWKVGLGAAVAEWHHPDDEDREVRASRKQALATLRLAHNVGSEPVQCEFEDIWY